MSRYIVDTNVVSEAWKPNPDESVINWLNRNVYYIPAPVVAEIMDGIEREPNAANQVRLRTTLTELMDETMTLDWDVETAMIWGQLRNDPKTKLKPMALWDSLIDAMGVRHNATIVTRNVSDFQHSPVLDPWQT